MPPLFATGAGAGATGLSISSRLIGELVLAGAMDDDAVDGLLAELGIFGRNPGLFAV